jgi:tetratricopeptide (TPR) repeat protein
VRIPSFGAALPMFSKRVSRFLSFTSTHSEPRCGSGWVLFLACLIGGVASSGWGQTSLSAIDAVLSADEPPLRLVHEMTPRQMEINGWYDDGKVALQSGQWGVAIDLFTRVIEVEKRFVPVYILRGLAYQRAGQYQESVQDLRMAIRMDPQRAGPYYLMALISEAYGAPQEALVWYERALRVDPEHVPSLHNRGVIRLGRNQVHEALADFEEAARRGAGLVEPLMGMAHIYVSRGRFGEALAACQRVRELDPEHPGLAMLLGRAFFGVSEYEEAIAAFSASIVAGEHVQEAERYRQRARDALGTMPASLAK